MEHVLDELLVQPIQWRVPLCDHFCWLGVAELLQRVPRGMQPSPCSRSPADSVSHNPHVLQFMSHFVCFMSTLHDILQMHPGVCAHQDARQ